MKLLTLDIETAPHEVRALVWKIWEQNLNPRDIIKAGYILCWAAKWYGSNEVLFAQVGSQKPESGLREIHTLLSEADAVVHYNGTRFDIPALNKEFLLAGMAPPAPFKQIDLYKVVKDQFRFPSNRLDYVARALGVGGKLEHEGSSKLWPLCMAGDKKAWATMESYNKQDVVITEGVYEKVKPWIRNHPNQNLYQEVAGCPVCGSTRRQSRGSGFTDRQRYKRYQCRDCGKWYRGTKPLATPPAAEYVNLK